LARRDRALPHPIEIVRRLVASRGCGFGGLIFGCDCSGKRRVPGTDLLDRLRPLGDRPCIRRDAGLVLTSVGNRDSRFDDWDCRFDDWDCRFDDWDCRFGDWDCRLGDWDCRFDDWVCRFDDWDCRFDNRVCRFDRCVLG
jgi:hypothetical protein